MIYKLTILLAATVSICQWSFAQGIIEFEKEVNDFGLVKEGELATFEFKFRNTGDAPVMLENVKASCGCTTPFWTKEAVQPGEEGTIKVSFNSNGRPGPFNKTITVASDASTVSKLLKIKGVVIKPPNTGELIINPDFIQLEKKSHNFGKVKLNDTYEAKIKITNNGSSPMSLGALKTGCYCIGYKMIKDTLDSGESGMITFTYKPRFAGEHTEKPIIYINEMPNTFLAFDIHSYVIESMGSPTLLNNSGGFDY